MDVAIQVFPNDKTVGSDTVQDLKEYNNQSLATQAKKGEQLVSMMPRIEKAFSLLGDDIVPLSTENDASKNRIGEYDEKRLREPKEKLFKQIDDERRANMYLSGMKRKDEQILLNGIYFL